MGHRLSKIYTRTGDDGTTGLGDGTRVEKNSLRVEAYGTVDELNSVLGVLLTYEIPDPIGNVIIEAQHTLFDLGGELCLPGQRALTEDHIIKLERTLDQLNADLAPLKEFILPGGVPAAAVCHLARTVCRRAERRVVSLGEAETVSEIALKYLNRLSDLLFVIARTLNANAGESDVFWKRDRNE